MVSAVGFCCDLLRRVAVVCGEVQTTSRWHGEWRWTVVNSWTPPPTLEIPTPIPVDHEQFS